MSLLIVEDDEAFVHLMQETLGLRDIRIARTLSEAMSMIDTKSPEVVVLDLTLPDSPIVQTLERIEEIKRRSQNATLIVITGHPDISKLEDTAIKGGANFVLSKDKGFFSALSAALVSTKRYRAPCASQPTVERIEEVVRKMTTEAPWPSI